LTKPIDLRKSWAILHEAVATWAFPGATACVVLDGKVVGEKAVGHFTYDHGAPRVTTTTMYDLASVSKTMVAWAVMSLVEEGRLDLDMTEATVGLMFEPQTLGLRELRSLGWLVNEPMFGRGFPRTVAHTGFTGTSLCIAPEIKLAVILLANRVQPTRANEKIRKVRADFHEALAAALSGSGGCQAVR
jgi:CubicO group peptidase (beta-lactamase class C family)